MLIQLNQITKTYNSYSANKCQALNNISVSIEDAELVAIIGKSGSGKTTLLNILGLVDSFSTGTYYLMNEDVSKLSNKKKALLRNKYFGYVMQDYSLIPEFSIFDNVALPLYIANVPLGEIKRKTNEALKNVDMFHVRDRKASELSGGQKQRVSIARAIVNNPKVILADEPTGALDVENGRKIINLLIELHNRLGVTVIIVTHDMDIANKCPRILNISDGIVNN